MPQLIEHIDKIARMKNRDVLYLVFTNENKCEDDSILGDLLFDYEDHVTRASVIRWLEENNIPYQPCAGEASENGYSSYSGSLYLDVPYDENNSDFIKLSEYLENPDGTMKIKYVLFGYFTLEMANKNKHHDEPGFWSKWAENL
ncbi:MULTISPECIES: hypothetical protein [Ferrimonas]|uniref:hypothetical protein n=1 Tax=Ferrimonas TaxID=44011 RepID=UPI0004824685|nr:MULTISPECIES: hypothetical protein [Ferrimonas]USD35839.1 hypothetical protein J8Z22_12370 [Ferrimonas sp. SCSIO 43195]